MDVVGDWLSRYDTNIISRERFGTARTYPGEDDCVDVVGELAFSGRSFDTEEPDRGLETTRTEPGKDDCADIVGEWFSRDER